MTQTQRKQLTRAFQIAARDALRAIRGTTRDGQPVYAVLSRSETARAGYPVYRLLTVQDGQIVCTCPAHQNGRICAHRAAVRSAIQAERDAATRRQAQADAAAQVATASERTASERREHSAPAPRPAFSMWA